jgi:hypothetical protein
VLSRAHGAKFVKWTPSRDHRAEPCWPLARRGVTDLPPSPPMRQSPSDGTLPNPRRKTRSSPPCAECRSRIDLPELRTDRNSAVPSRTDLHTVNLAHVKYVFHYFHAWRGRVARDRNAPRCEPCRLASCTCDRLLRAPPVTASDEASPMLRCITPIARGSTPGNLSRG